MKHYKIFAQNFFIHPTIEKIFVELIKYNPLNILSS